MSGQVMFPILLLRVFDHLIRLEEIFDAVLVYERRSEEPINSRIEKSRIVIGNHVGSVREDTELAIPNMVINLKRVLVHDQVVIAGQDKRGRRYLFQRTWIDMRLVKSQLAYF